MTLRQLPLVYLGDSFTQELSDAEPLVLLDRVDDILNLRDLVLETSPGIVLKLDLLVELFELVEGILGCCPLADSFLVKTERSLIFGSLS